MNITKNKQIYRPGEQTSGYQCRKGVGKVQDMGKRVRDTNY